MGMYNEVWAPCPDCGKSIYAQISQVVLGFGGFDLASPCTMEDLTLNEKKLLARCLEAEEFWCEDHGKFYVTIEVTDTSKRNKFTI